MKTRAVTEAFELTPGQEGMLYHAQMDDGSGVYQVQLWTRLSGALDEDAFRAALAWAVQRHPALRTGFLVRGVAKPRQFVLPEVPLPLETLDWRGAGDAEVEARLQALRADETARGFRLSAPPLVRLKLVRLADDEHLLVWTLHHLVVDGWSYTLVFRELLARYDALVSGGTFEPPAPRPYRDFIAWMRRRDRAADEAYWRAEFGGFREPTPLGIDGTGGGAGEAERSHFLTPEATQAVHAAARLRRVTPGTLLSAAWALLLSRYSGADDVVFGVTSSGRPEGLAGSELTCGLFVNSPPARVTVADDAELGAWLREVQSRQLALREHEHTALVDIQGWTEVPRGRPLFESLLAYENFPRIDGATRGTGGLRVGRMEGGTRTSLPLTLVVHPGERLHLRVYHDRARVGDAAAARLLRHLEATLAAFAAAPPELRLGDIDPVSAEERAQLLALAGEARALPEAPVHALVAEQAAARPEAVAVRAADGVLTYAELDARANRLARHLAACGVGPGDRVAVALERSAAAVVALLAVMRAGGAYLPLDAALPAERLAYLLDDAGARVVVGDDRTLAALPLAGRTAVSVDGDRDRIAAHEPGAPPVAVGPDAPVYAVYTSGSTGAPKGVLVPHRAVVRLVRNTNYADFGPSDVFLHLAPASFDAATLELWGALCNGACVAVHPPFTPSPDELAAFLAAEGVSVAWLTAGLFHAMVDGRLDGLGGLRLLLAGGDVLSVPHVRRMLETHPGVRLVNGYGPTENTTFTACHTVGAADLDRPSIPIGRPVANTRVYVLDRRLRPVPAGVPGELCAGGDGVAIGYLGAPEATAERFVEVTVDGRAERLYRTGDRVRWTEDGVLEFLGRMDAQLKVRGYRVEPGEIEAALRTHPSVADAAVAARGEGAARRLVAWVVAAGAEAADPAALRAHLAARLPAYMVPDAWVALGALPLNANGKVDRRALPEPDAAGAPAAAPVEARTATEGLLAELWAEVLGGEAPGVHDSFFEAGGHSLLAMQLSTRVRDVLSAELPLRTFFEAPTVAGAAAALLEADPRVEAAARIVRDVRALADAEVRAALEAAGLPVAAGEPARRRALRDHRLRAEGADPGAADAIVPRAPGAEAPLTFAQERMWVLDRLEPGNPAYTISMGMRLSGALDAAVLRRAFAEVVRRHEALRTTIREGDGGPVQVVDATLPLDWSERDLAPLPPAPREAALAAYLGAEAARAFDLAQDAPLRVRLVRLGEAEHALAVLVHHAVADGWSLAILQRELSALYAAFLQGLPSPLPEPALQYADFAVWQRGPAAEAVDRQLDWWREQLAGLPEALELPGDFPRPAVRSNRGGVRVFRFPPKLAASLRELSRAEGTTLFMTLLAGYVALVHRTTGEEDFAVGTPIAGRSRREAEGMIGLFANTLVLRARVAAGEPFRALLRRVREGTLDAFAHQEVPFERLVEAVRTGRSLSHTPLFQVMFGLQNSGEVRPRLEGVEVERLPVDTGGARFDLTWSLAEREGTVMGLLEYADDLFLPETADRMVEQLRVLLEAAAADPALPVAALPLLVPGERERLLEWGAVPGAPVEGTALALLEAQCQRTPEAQAVVCRGETLSYAELHSRAERMARHLAACGAGPEQRVGVCLERTPELIVALLAVLKTGAAYVPLDPAYPAERIDLVLGDAGARVLVTDAEAAARLHLAESVAVVRVDADRAAIDRHPDGPLGARVDAENLSHVIYTSGSTGRPKGVMIRHGSVASLLHWMHRRFPLAPGERVAATTSVSFDVSIAEIHYALSCGATLVLLENALSIAEPGALAGAVQASMVPGAAAELLRAGALPGSLRRLNLGGEALAPELARALYAAGVPEVHDLYGPTEDTTYSTHAHVAADGVQSTLGRSVGARTAYVLDGRLELVPAGVPGEIWLAGAGVARGYLDRPALTAERFVPDPFAARPGARMYRSGDRGRWTSAGALEYQGRIDFQVKVRGFRIEPGEIEAVLQGAPGVDEAAVAVRKDATGDLRIVAYVSGGATPPACREWLAARLPEYMVPAAVVTLAALPRTPNGKLDRRALPEPEWAAHADTFVAPRDATEEALVAIWSDVLATARVGVNDDFFALGGHSLKGTQLVTRIRSVFGVDLPLRTLFETPTVAALARRVDAERGVDSAAGADPVVPLPRDGTPLPLSFAQLRLWFLDQLEPDSARYNMAASLSLAGALDVEALRRTFEAIVNRHEALRSTIGSRGGEPVQVIHPHLPFDLPVHDLSQLPDEVREAAVDRLSADEVDRPIDLARGPLLRGSLYRLGPDRHVLLLVMHHVVSDGWSMGIMLREMRALYGAFLAGQAPPLAPLPVQYADYAGWQRRYLEGGAMERQLAYWRDALRGAPTVLELPTDHPRPAVQRYRGSNRTHLLDPPLVRALNALARREGATLYMVMLAAFYTLLHRYTGQRDLLVGTPVANRMRPEVEELIGFFVNTLVVRTDAGGDPSFRTLVKRVRDSALGAYAHQDIPFERVVEELGVSREMSHEPLFQVMFVLQNAVRGELELPGLVVESRSMERRTTKFDFTVFYWAEGDGLRGWWEYNLDLWEAETVERMLGHYQELLRSAVADPGRPIGSLPLLTDGERRTLLDTFNDTARPLPDAACVHHLFERQVRRTPEATAVVFEGERLSFAELNARANQLAHHLRTLGVGPDLRVGICVERSLEMVVALLGILKAGGAIVAIDPTYPEERIAFMVRDAGLTALLTQERLAASMPAVGTQVVLLDRWAPFAALSTDDPRVPLSSDHLMYCIYTSGSTGIPKGVGVPHREFLNLLEWQWSCSGLSRQAKTVQFATFGFCVSFQECFGTWCAGSTVVVVPEHRRRDLEALMEVLRDEEVERLYVPFAALKHLAEIRWEEGRLATSLREVVTAGEQLRVTDSMRAFFRRLGGCVLHNQYGSSETHVVAAFAMEGDPDGWPALPPVGRPVSNARLYLLDDRLEPVPMGVPGEVCAGGEACLPRGYLGDAALTAQKLVPDPFSGVAGARMYRSGDVGRLHPDGTVEVTGRLDFQIKIRGFRVELGEVETAIRRIPEIRDVAVVASENRFGQKRLVAYPVFREQAVPAHLLADELKRRLPEYMIPSAWVPVDRLPVNANGKLDAAALPSAEEADTEGADTYVAPSTPTEALLAEAWSEVLARPGIGVRDNFFEVGGHSLMATQVMARVRERCRADVPLRALFENPTIEALARAVDAAPRLGAEAAEERVTARRRTVRAVRIALGAEEG